MIHNSRTRIRKEVSSSLLQLCSCIIIFEAHFPTLVDYQESDIEQEALVAVALSLSASKGESYLPSSSFLCFYLLCSSS